MSTEVFHRERGSCLCDKGRYKERIDKEEEGEEEEAAVQVEVQYTRETNKIRAGKSKKQG